MARNSQFSQGRRRKRLMGEINVVPYIDVMLVLLVIFMVTAPLLQEGIQVELPKTAAGQVSTDNLEPFILSVDADGQVFLNEEEQTPATAEEIRLKAAAVLRHQPQTPFLVRGDASATYAEVILAMSMLQQAGVPNVGLITEPASGGQ